MKILDSYRWTNNNIKIDDFYDLLPPIIKDLVNECEEADKNEDWSYTNICESLENMSKEFVVSGEITLEQWNRLCCRYCG